MATLLPRLDLERPGLSEVNAAQADTERAARRLLAYYRARTSVRHPVDRAERKSYRGKRLSKRDSEYAANALRHVFVGQPSYGFHARGEDIDWATNPVRDKEWIWQLHRMYWWPSMGKAYWHTGEERHAREWVAQLLDWVEKNPRDGRHRYAWRTLEAGIRLRQWTHLFQYFVDSPSFTPAALASYLNSVYEHADYLMKKPSGGGNWLLHESEGLLYGGVFFPEFKDAPGWRSEAIRRFTREITRQVHPDGHQKELAIGYHIGTISSFSNGFELARMNGLEGEFPEDFHRTLERMAAAVMKLSLPDGRYAQFGDAWAGSPGGVQRLFQGRNWADTFGREDFRYIATDGKKGRPPAETAFALPESGLYSMRSGWDKRAVCLVLKCGPDGGWHCQPDNGTFELAAGGRQLMPDSGCYIYSGDPKWRAWFRQTRVHQTLTLDGRNSAYRPKLLLWKPGALSGPGGAGRKRPGKMLDALVVENESYKGLTHRRAVLFVGRRWFVIVDEALGEAQGDVRVHFQLAPGRAIFDGPAPSARTDFPGGTNLLVQAMPDDGLALEEEKGWVSFKYTKKEKRPAFCWRRRKDAETKGLRFVTVLVPFASEQNKGRPPRVDVSLVEPPPPGADRVSIELTVGVEAVRLTYDLKEKTASLRQMAR